MSHASNEPCDRDAIAQRLLTDTEIEAGWTVEIADLRISGNGREFTFYFVAGLCVGPLGRPVTRMGIVRRSPTGLRTLWKTGRRAELIAVGNVADRALDTIEHGGRS